MLEFVPFARGTKSAYYMDNRDITYVIQYTIYNIIYKWKIYWVIMQTK